LSPSTNRSVVVGSLVLAIGMLLVACKREPVPAYFGIWFQSSQGLREIPMQGDPAYNAASARFKAVLGKGKPDEFKLAVKALYDSC